MRPIDQTIFVDPAEPPEARRGDCMAACVATLLELSLGDVPNFVEAGEGWWAAFTSFVYGRGFCAVSTPEPLPALGMMVGRSPRGEWNHLVVAHGDDVVHDPHPTRSGVIDPSEWWYLVPVDPMARRS